MPEEQWRWSVTVSARRSLVWYAVSVLIALERKKKPRYLVFENVYLFRAHSPGEARKKAALLGQDDANAQTDMRWDGTPVRVVFVGVRKVVSCAANPSGPRDPRVYRMHDGVEATYSRFVLSGKTELRRLVDGKPVSVVYEE